jgi:hypothetical protein
MTDPTQFTMKEILSSLTISQVWTLVGVIITTLTTTFVAGGKLYQLSQSQPDVVPCAHADNYPIGTWLVAGEDRSPAHAGLTQNIKLDTPQTATT